MACTLLNQIFYTHKKFDTPDDIYTWESYMLNDTFIQKYAPLIEPDVEVEMSLPPPPQVTKRHALFSPRKEDTLFWSIYVLHHGEAEYTMIGGKYKNAELLEKQNILAYIQQNRNLIKSCAQSAGVKVSNVRMQETAAEMMINKKTSWHAFHVMCMFYKINALVIQGELYMKFFADPEYKTYRFERNHDGHVSVDVGVMQPDDVATVESTLLHVDPFLPKLLKGVSNYKLPELEDMGKKLCVTPPVANPKKNDWYDVIINKLVKMLIQN
jgi:hypothetical protein